MPVNADFAHTVDVRCLEDCARTWTCRLITSKYYSVTGVFGSGHLFRNRCFAIRSRSATRYLMIGSASCEVEDAVWVRESETRCQMWVDGSLQLPRRKQWGCRIISGREKLLRSFCQQEMFADSLQTPVPARKISQSLLTEIPEKRPLVGAKCQWKVTPCLRQSDSWMICLFHLLTLCPCAVKTFIELTTSGLLSCRCSKSESGVAV